MSNLKVTNIQSKGTGFNDVVSFQNASGTENGTLCRAWVNFDGTFDASSYGDEFTTANGGIRAAFNVTSILDGGTGTYTINLTNAMPDANYAIVLTSNQYLTLQGATPTTNSFSMNTYSNYTTPTFVDAGRAYAAVFA